MNDSLIISKYLPEISSSFIFQGLSEAELPSILLSRSNILQYEVGEAITKGESKRLGVIILGSASVINIDAGTKLNTLLSSDCFGFVTLFNDCPHPNTLIVAEEKAVVLFIEEPALEEMMKNDIRIALNYIRYLSEKVCFLNEKINGFVKYGAKERLKEYIGKHMVQKGEHIEVNLKVPIKEFSNILNVGRASLYRAFDDLEKEGIIRKEQKTIKILNKDYFEEEVKLYEDK